MTGVNSEPFQTVRNTALTKNIAHELIHLKYLDSLKHGPEFDKRVDDLVKTYKERKKNKEGEGGGVGPS